MKSCGREARPVLRVRIKKTLASRPYLSHSSIRTSFFRSLPINLSFVVLSLSLSFSWSLLLYMGVSKIFSWSLTPILLLNPLPSLYSQSDFGIYSSLPKLPPASVLSPPSVSPISDTDHCRDGRSSKCAETSAVLPRSPEAGPEIRIEKRLRSGSLRSTDTAQLNEVQDAGSVKRLSRSSYSDFPVCLSV